jgi:hypothetical protein
MSVKKTNFDQEIQNSDTVREINEDILDDIFEEVVSPVKSITLDLSKLTAINCETKSNTFGEAGVCTAVYSKFGKRLMFPKDVYIRLGSPSELSVSLYGDAFIVGASIPNNNQSYPVKQQSSKYIIYKADLVEKISEHLNLDLGDGEDQHVCSTFYNIEYIEQDDTVLAKISK